MKLRHSKKLACITIGVLASCLVPTNASTVNNPRVILQTTLGQIEITLLPDRAPLTVDHFLGLVQQGHYDGLIFHRVIENFMIQGGGYTPALEYRDSGKSVKNESDNGLSNLRGTIAMARNSDPDSASAQFYINVKDNGHLNSREGAVGYTVFGFVTQGMQVVESIALIDTHTKQGMPAVPIVPLATPPRPSRPTGRNHCTETGAMHGVQHSCPRGNWASS